MNKVILKGRLCKDPLISQSGETKIAAFNLAVQRDKETADFISCKAFNKTAEFITTYFKKGNEILVEGQIQTGSYTGKDGNTRYVTDVLVNKCEFCGSKNEEAPVEEKKVESATQQSFEVKDEELPF